VRRLCYDYLALLEAPRIRGETMSKDSSINPSDKEMTAEVRARICEDFFLNSQTGMLVVHLDKPGDPASLRLVLANAAASNFVGFDVRAEVGRLVVDIFPKNVELGLSEAYMRVAESGGEVDMGEVSYDDKRVHGVFSTKVFAMPDHRIGITFEKASEHKRA